MNSYAGQTFRLYKFMSISLRPLYFNVTTNDFMKKIDLSIAKFITVNSLQAKVRGKLFLL